MERAGYFVAGFAAGWAVRTTVDSSRALAVKAISSIYGVVDRAGRAIGMEREHLEDLFAEARAKYEADRARATRADAPERARTTPHSRAPATVQDRAA
jgi:hypothetical protein